MAMHPEIQRKAQKQLDDVIGDGRLPLFSDRPKLPYIDAVLRESLRWQQVLPLGVAHRLTEDDEYRGYFIPKGTLVTANQWYDPFSPGPVRIFECFAELLIASRAILHDPDVYPEPHTYMPDRFITKAGKLDPSVLDPRKAAFGFGRRYVLAVFSSAGKSNDTSQNLSGPVLRRECFVHVHGIRLTRLRYLA